MNGRVEPETLAAFVREVNASARVMPDDFDRAGV